MLLCQFNIIECLPEVFIPTIAIFQQGALAAHAINEDTKFMSQKSLLWIYQQTNTHSQQGPLSIPL